MFKMIIADDMEAICIYLKQFINQWDSEIDVCAMFSNGHDTVEYIKENQADIVLVDIKMPVLSGLDVAEYIYNHHPDTKVIIMSAYSDFEYARRAIRYHVFDYLQKAININELKSVLQRVKKLIREEREYQKIELEKARDEERTYFFKELSEKRELSECTWKSLYPDIRMEDAQIIYYQIIMRNYKEILKNRWKYEGERLIDSIYGIVRMTLMEMKVYNVEFLDYSEAGIEVAIVCDKEANLEIERVKENLEHLAGLLTEWVTKSIVGSDRRKTEYIEELPISEETIRAVEAAKKYIRKHIGDGISRGDIANYVGYSVSHFTRIFSKVAGISVSKYIFDVRMERVIELLNTDMTIREVAEKTGYNNTRQLRRNLEVYTGYTPVEYRKKVLHKYFGED